MRISNVGRRRDKSEPKNGKPDILNPNMMNQQMIMPNMFQSMFFTCRLLNFFLVLEYCHGINVREISIFF